AVLRTSGRSRGACGSASRGRSRRGSAEAPVAPLIFGERGLELLAREVGPVAVDEHELAIGNLPEQEVGQAELTARADEKIRIGQISRVEISGEALLRHLCAAGDTLCRALGVRV